MFILYLHKLCVLRDRGTGSRLAAALGSIGSRTDWQQHWQQNRLTVEEAYTYLGHIFWRGTHMKMAHFKWPTWAI